MKGKKSFLMYADFIGTFEALLDDEAGRLIKHLFRYVNDLNPEPPDRITQIAFDPIKNQLKRDLNEWRGVLDKCSEAGKKSAEMRKSQHKATHLNPPQPTSTHLEKKQPTNTVVVTDTVVVTENVIVNETQIQPVFEDIKNFFGFQSEINHIQKWQQIRGFLNTIISAGKFEWFKKQFSDYKIYKSTSAEKIHSFGSFIEGAWDAGNWEHKLKEFKKTSSASNSKTPPTDQVYIPPVKKAGRTPEEYAEVLRQDRDRLEKLAKEYKPGPEQPPNDNSLGSRMRKQFDNITPKP